MSDTSTLLRLRQLILAGTLSTTAPLGEVSTAALLGVSRPTVREALRALAAEGLVRSDGRRLWITAMSASSLVDELQVRAALEGLCAGLAAARVADGDVAPSTLRRLRALADRTESVTAEGEGSRAQAVELNRHFHLGVSELAGSQASQKILSETWNRILLATLQSLSPEERPVQVASEHRQILQAIERGDSARAEQAARAHVLGTIAAVTATES